ncbi:MAG: hypothetical protein KAI59_05560 [Planctomycetes bacterium]|nr:hypothetical protein [Planctomycetota bacterium]MCK5473480.1 hypothetical protein [Planctomycetota bacterium]
MYKTYCSLAVEKPQIMLSIVAMILIILAAFLGYIAIATALKVKKAKS